MYIHYSRFTINTMYVLFSFQIAEALSYLHGAEQTLHNNVCPASILINKRGMWKLGGMSFSVKSRDGKVRKMRQLIFIFCCDSSPFCGATGILFPTIDKCPRVLLIIGCTFFLHVCKHLRAISDQVRTQVQTYDLL